MMNSELRKNVLLEKKLNEKFVKRKNGGRNKKKNEGDARNVNVL